MNSRHSYLENKSKPRVAIFDLLREGMIMNILLEKDKTKKLGQFSSLPEFCLMHVGKKDTGIDNIVLLKDFNLSVVMDVYEVTESFLEELDEYYGYYWQEYDLNHNKRIKIDTPYGEAYTYVNNVMLKEGIIIPGGDLEDYLEYGTRMNIPTHKFENK